MSSRLDHSQQEHNAAAKRIAERFARTARNMTPEDRTDLIDDLMAIADEEVYGDLLDRIEGAGA